MLIIGGKIFCNALAYEKYKEEVDKAFESAGKDMSTEGKKSGYEIASREYEKVYADLEQRYMQVINRIEKNWFLAKKGRRLADELNLLGKEEGELEEKIDKGLDEVEKRFSISKSKIKELLQSKASIVNPAMLEILILLSVHNKIKERQYIKAEQKGYEEAKREHTAKVKKFEDKLTLLIEKSEVENRNIISSIATLLYDISEKYTRIAELRIILNK